MKTQPATPVASASFDGMKNWHALDWARIQQTVRKTQLKIAGIREILLLEDFPNTAS
ncbi:hypothetical protein SSTU70S_06364 [Stutzerimonas stutzeri]